MTIPSLTLRKKGLYGHYETLFQCFTLPLRSQPLGDRLGGLRCLLVESCRRLCCFFLLLVVSFGPVVDFCV